MKITKKIVNQGSNLYLEVDDKNNFMNMDVKIIKLLKEETYFFESSNTEKAILLIQGKIICQISDKKYHFNRIDPFQELPSAIHFDLNKNCLISCLKDSEILLIEAQNEKTFDYKLYEPSILKVTRFGENKFANTANRNIVDIINYQNSPHSKIVLGEVITYPGNWSSWPPHHHDQPEMYIFKFNKEQGFGTAYLDDSAYVVKNYDAICIPGGVNHPTNTAPGYAMYFIWIISNLPNNPWTKRELQEEHKWTEDINKYWPNEGKK